MCQLAAEKVCIPFLLDGKATLILPESAIFTSGKMPPSCPHSTLIARATCGGGEGEL